MGVLAPLREIPPPDIARDGACYILIDALDEAALYRRTASQRTIVEILEPRLSMFPPWLRLLATTRPGISSERLQNIHVCRLRARDRQNLDDVHSYLATRLGKVVAELPPTTVQTLVDRSGGNFLYLKFATGQFRGADLTDCRRGSAGSTAPISPSILVTRRTTLIRQPRIRRALRAGM
jgi:hypothetical protein